MDAAVLAQRSFWPSWEQLVRVLTLRDYNTRVVMLGTMLLGAASGMVGSFLMLRKRALMGDAVSHATLPGIGVAFIVMALNGGSGKWMPGLLLGATVAGLFGMGAVLLIRNLSRVKEDAALGIVLSVFFGLGAAVLGVVQNMQAGSAAGLETFIYGRTASMLAVDAWRIAIAGGAVAAGTLLLFKEMTLLCFDQDFAASQGWPVHTLDVAMMALVVGVTVIGLQAVGLILMVALLVIPSAAARFWTDRLPGLVAIAATMGALSGLIGAGLSALVPRLPAGAIIILIAAAGFIVSLILGPARGLLARGVRRVRLARAVSHQNLMRAMYERQERLGITNAEGTGEQSPVSFTALMVARSWSRRALGRLLRRDQRRGLVERVAPGYWRLTAAGAREARRVVRNHRLWEIFLITHAEIAPSHVDRDADQIEHVLDAELVRELEGVLAERHPHLAVPPSPHALDGEGGTAN